ncbi:MAG: hypothetical protein IT291_07515 [Deltaproteobacteria bacterium]|nr:hypothetical protein [Deltaproteobacteria bacterium]
MPKIAAPNKKSLAFYSIVVTLVVGIFLYLVIGSGERTFPALPDGTYAGEISGITTAKNKFQTFYVEKAFNASALLMVIFNPGWVPQLVPFEVGTDRINGKDVQGSTDHYKPVALMSEGRKFLLTGALEEGGYTGNVDFAGKRIGSWRIRPITQSGVVNEPSGLSVSEEEFRKWLESKVQLSWLRRRATKTANVIERIKRKKEKLTRVVTDEDTLRAKASEQVAKLETEVRDVSSRRDELDKQINGLISELSLLERITKRGKSIALARRVAEREQRWYMANWQTDDEASGFGELGASGAGSSIDLSALEKRYRIAANIQVLYGEIAAEKRKIEELEKELEHQSEESAKPEAPGETGPAEEKKSFWNKLLGG